LTFIVTPDGFTGNNLLNIEAELPVTWDKSITEYYALMQGQACSLLDEESGFR